MESVEKDPKLVYVDDYGIPGTNFYWHKYEAKGLTKDDILLAGLTSDRVQLAELLIAPLLEADTEFRTRGYQAYIKEGYRSRALYEIIYERRVEKFGKEETDSLLNMADMPHADGTALDLALWDVKENKEVYMRRGEDGTPALFVDFYKNSNNPEDKRYQELQEWVIATMQKNGFRLGTKNEYFHFNYRPDEPENYPQS